MRVTALIIVLAILGFAGVAEAEKVKTNQSTKLYSRPGEQAKVLLKVKEGQSMTVLAKEGRWLKVRVQGRTGYVPRSKVDAGDDDEIARNTRRRPFVDGRSRSRGSLGGEGPDDRVGADATGEGQDDDSDKGKGKGKGDDDEDETPKKPVRTAKLEKSEKSSKAEKPAKPEKEDKGDDEDEDEKPTKPTKTSKPAKTEKADKEDKDDDKEPVVDDEKTEEPKEDDRATAHVSEKTEVYTDPNRKSDVIFTARPSDLLFPSDKNGKWTFVENSEGDGGWVETSMLDVQESGGGGGGRKKEIDVGARLGLTFIQQGMRTAGGVAGKVPDNYNVGTSAADVALGVGYFMPYKSSLVLGGELGYTYARTVFGGIFYDPDGAAGPMPGVSTGITIHNLNARISLGKDFKKKNGMVVLGRVGLRYQGYVVDNFKDFTKNPARLPSENIYSPTIGAALSLPRLSGKLGLVVGLDAALVGTSVSQTAGLEDGKSPSAKQIFLGAGLTYHWKKAMDLIATYDLAYTAIDFGAPVATSMRMHTGTDVQRTDVFHTVTFGIAKGF